MGIFIALISQKRNNRENSAIIHCLFFSIFIFVFVFSLFCWDCKKVKTKKVDHAIEMISFYLISFFKLKLWWKSGERKDGYEWEEMMHIIQVSRTIQAHQKKQSSSELIFLSVSLFPWLFFDLKKGFFMKKH